MKGEHVSITESTFNQKKKKSPESVFHSSQICQNIEQLAICNMTCWVTQVSAMWTSLIGFVTDVLIQLVDFTFTAMYLSGHVFTLVLYIKLNIVLKCWHECPLCSWLGYSFMCKCTTNLRPGCFYPILGTLNKSSCGRMSWTHSLHPFPPFSLQYYK